MKNLRKKGISLIVLIITIIVIIILATAVIQSFSNNNPIEKAKEATFLSDIKTIEEDVNMYALNKQLDNYSYDITDINLFGEEMVKEIPSTKNYKEKIEIVGGQVMLKENVSEEEKKWASKYDIQIKEKEVVIPNGFVKSQATGETEISTGLVIYEGEEPVTDANVLEAKKTRNQFVWVPVEDFSKFKRTTTYNGTITDPGSDHFEPYTDASEEQSEYYYMMASVQKYGGFYIARYEASESGSVAGKYPSINVDRDDAITLARKIYPKIDIKGAVSTLCYGVQWDATVTWIYKTYSSKDIKGHIGESTGNGVLDVYQATGENAEYSQNNIYDMMGNLMECTMERRYITEGFLQMVYRGGSCLNCNGISDRDYVDGDVQSYDGFGYRIALYIK